MLRTVLNTVLRTCALLLPALVPSWRFFKTIAPSPRIEYRLIGNFGVSGWRESHPRPRHVPPAQIVRRLFWNPSWNEQLFLVSCAERLDEEPTQHSIDEINKRVAATLPIRAGAFLQFRIVFVSRLGQNISEINRFRKHASASRRCPLTLLFA